MTNRKIFNQIKSHADNSVGDLKKVYSLPVLKTYGHIAQLTQSTGTQNADAAQNKTGKPILG